MIDYLTITYFVIFVPIAYIANQCLQAFDYSKFLRRGKVFELRFLIFIISIILGHLFAETIVGIIERIMEIVV